MSEKVFVVVFETIINGQLARVEIPTVKDPLNSRQIRKDCEVVAQASFRQLDPHPQKGDYKIKAVECIEIRGPAADSEKDFMNQKSS